MRRALSHQSVKLCQDRLQKSNGRLTPHHDASLCTSVSRKHICRPVFNNHLNCDKRSRKSFKLVSPQLLNELKLPQCKSCALANGFFFWVLLTPKHINCILRTPKRRTETFRCFGGYAAQKSLSNSLSEAKLAVNKTFESSTQPLFFKYEFQIYSAKKVFSIWPFRKICSNLLPRLLHN